MTCEYICCLILLLSFACFLSFASLLFLSVDNVGVLIMCLRLCVSYSFSGG